MDIKLLEKFYQGGCSEEEVWEVLSWFDAKSDQEHVLRHLQAYWQEFEQPKAAISQHDPSVLLTNIHARLRKERSEECKKGTMKPIDTNRFYFFKIAAILVLAFGLTFLVQKMMPIAQLPEISSLVIKEARKGQKQTIMLPDGTRVTLNADSRLSYPETFLANKREVMLEGEAFFEVAREEKRTFTITSRGICTTVLGTSFNVRAYQDEQQISVSVASGQVKVSQKQPAKHQAYYLLPGQEVVYQSGKQTFTVKDFDPKETLAWKENILYFKDATFEEVKKAMERWYGVEIQVVGRDNQAWQYSGTFHRQSLENVLLSIGYVKQFTYEINGKQVKIIFSNP